MNQKLTIAVDAMSGDHGPQVAVPAVLAALSDLPQLQVILVGDEAQLTPMLKQVSDARLSVRHATEVVSMHESPSQALRGKKQSSMRIAIDLVKEGIAQACVSAGNTGALMATARFVLKMLPGIDRPAIITAIPASSGHTLMLDLGANADSTAEHLFQFAVMGSALASAVYNIERPTVGLLNIGAEEIKGTDRVREAAQKLQASELNYIGFVEGNDIFSSNVDVVVSDGFAGNVSLKTMEGVAKMITRYIREEFSRNLCTQLLGMICRPVLLALRSRLDARKYNGASFLGIRGIVIKSHGSADVLAFENAVRIAAIEVEKQVPSRISALLRSQLDITEKSDSRAVNSD